MKVLSGSSLSSLQAVTIDALPDKRDRGLASELVYGVLRHYWQIDYLLSCLLSKPLKSKDDDIRLHLLLGLYELWQCRTPDYAVVNETVNKVRRSRKKWAASMINAVLRRFEREKETLEQQLSAQPEPVRLSHPKWMVDMLRRDWPGAGADAEPGKDTGKDSGGWQYILQQNNLRAPMYLRVNSRQLTPDQYLHKLVEQGIEAELDGFTQPAHTAIRLRHSMDARSLPGFEQGQASVQDIAAQMAAVLLPVEPGQRVLDLCAAPGGKTCHLLEAYPGLDRLVAVEIDETRMQRVQENLDRLQLHDGKAELVTADVLEYRQWWDGTPFDRILIDAPCSASGVIRRHPDIKLLRREQDISVLVELQKHILDSAWQMLAPGGLLLYATCSLFRDENDRQVQAFLGSTADAQEDRFEADWGIPCEAGRQLLPGHTDGFYYCRLKKTA